jgi:hypothetical protein
VNIEYNLAAKLSDKAFSRDHYACAVGMGPTFTAAYAAGQHMDAGMARRAAALLLGNDRVASTGTQPLPLSSTRASADADSMLLLGKLSQRLLKHATGTEAIVETAVMRVIRDAWLPVRNQDLGTVEFTHAQVAAQAACGKGRTGPTIGGSTVRLAPGDTWFQLGNVRCNDAVTLWVSARGPATVYACMKAAAGYILDMSASLSHRALAALLLDASEPMESGRSFTVPYPLLYHQLVAALLACRGRADVMYAWDSYNFKARGVAVALSAASLSAGENDATDADSDAGTALTAAAEELVLASRGQAAALLASMLAGTQLGAILAPDAELVFSTGTNYAALSADLQAVLPHPVLARVAGMARLRDAFVPPPGGVGPHGPAWRSPELLANGLRHIASAETVAAGAHNTASGGASLGAAGEASWEAATSTAAATSTGGSAAGARASACSAIAFGTASARSILATPTFTAGASGSESGAAGASRTAVGGASAASSSSALASAATSTTAASTAGSRPSDRLLQRATLEVYPAFGGTAEEAPWTATAEQRASGSRTLCAPHPLRDEPATLYGGQLLRAQVYLPSANTG